MIFKQEFQTIFLYFYDNYSNRIVKFTIKNYLQINVIKFTKVYVNKLKVNKDFLS